MLESVMVLRSEGHTIEARPRESVESRAREAFRSCFDCVGYGSCCGASASRRVVSTVSRGDVRYKTAITKLLLIEVFSGITDAADRGTIWPATNSPAPRWARVARRAARSGLSSAPLCRAGVAESATLGVGPANACVCGDRAPVFRSSARIRCGAADSAAGRQRDGASVEASAIPPPS